MSKKSYVEAVLNGVDSAIAECQQKVFVRLVLHAIKLIVKGQFLCVSFIYENQTPVA